MDIVKFISSDTGSSTDAEPTLRIWGDCQIKRIIEEGIGIFHHDDWQMAHKFASATPAQGYETFQSTGVTIQPATDEQGGVLEIAGADADNDEGILQAGSGVAGEVAIRGGANAKDFWFEARVKIDTLVDRGFFIGLAEANKNGTNELFADDSAALQSIDYVGFHAATAAPATVNAVYGANGQAGQIAAAAAHTFTANTYTKFGLKYSASKKELYFYVNGTLKATLAESIITGTLFPGAAADIMTRTWGIIAGEAVEKKSRMDWWRIAQMR